MATRKPTAKKAPREKKYNDEIVKRAIALRKTKGLGFLKVARAIEEEFGIKVSPAALRAATLRFKGVDSLNELAKKPKVQKEVAIAASSRIDRSDERDAAVKSGQ